MTDQTYAEEVISYGLSTLQQEAWTISERHGHHEESDILKAPFKQEPGITSSYDQGDVRALRHYYSEKLLLLHSEISEAHDEMRDGHAMDETYYSETDLSLVKKPLGVPSELADIVIRVAELAQEAGIDLNKIVIEKMKYNKTRPYRHGRKGF